MQKLGDYEFLITLYHSKNLTQAAQALFVSQPALTKRLQQIEHELDTVIVYRNVKGVQFTPEGEYIVQYAMRSLEEYKELRRALLGLHERKETTITIASAGSLSHEILPELFQRFGELHPDIHLILHAIGSGEAAQRVHNGQADLAFVCGDQPWVFEQDFIRQEYMTMIYSKPVELADLPFLPRIDSRMSANTKNMITNWWQNNFDIPPRIGMNVPSIQTCVEMVTHGLGYSILMDHRVYQNESGLYRCILKDNRGEPIARNDYLIYLAETAQRPPVRTFIEFCRTYFGPKFGKERKNHH